ncbi:MAG: leucine-rich repeat protein [Kiritimatiellae bacterium]|nr:leucine-rich repeat protein [Kiritimatiellia bacterium]
MRKLVFAAAAAVWSLWAAAATPAQLYSAIGSPDGVTVLGTSDWDVGTDATVGLGSKYAKSSNAGVGSSQSSLNLEFTGAHYLNFAYSISSESNYDKLSLVVDGSTIKTFSGTENSSCSHLVSGTGTHSVTLKYSKDVSGDVGLDMAAIASLYISDAATLIIPASVTSIAASKYANETTFKKVVFESGSKLTSVGDNAFKGCTSLESIEFPEGLTTLGDGVFDGCSSLTQIALPSTLESLGTIDVSTTTALADSFGDGYWVTCGWVIGYRGDCPAEIPEADRIRGFAKGALENCQSIEVFAPGTSVLAGIGANAFRYCFNLSWVELPSSLKSIGARAFEGCTSLEEIAVPGSVSSIGEGAFRYCYSLQYAAIASGVASIGYRAFYDDYLLQEIDLPATVATIGDEAFGGDSSIIRVGVRGDLKVLSSIFSNYRFIREVTVKDGPGTLKTGLFAGCDELEDVRFLASAAPALESDTASPFTDKVPKTCTVYVPSGSTGWCAIEGAPGLPQAWPKNSSSERRSIAYWNVPTYLVEFDSNGGSLGVQTTYQKPETAFRLPPQPVQSGYTFGGWWTSPVEGWQVTSDTVFLEGVYTRLYAHWIRPHRIFLNANGGTVTNSTVTYVEQTVYGVLPAPVRTGYAFGGWTYQGETVVPDMQFLDDADHTLTAQWKAYRYSVHFLPNGGSGSAIAQEFKYDTMQSLEKCTFTRAGYTCVGWAKTPGGAVAYTDGQMVKNLTALQGGIVNLYAVWAKNYTIVFNKGDGSGVKSSQTFPYGYSRRLPAIKNGLHWERTGFKFKGWATSEAKAKAGTVWKANWSLVSNATAAGKTLNVYGVWEVVSPYYAIRYNKYDGSDAFRTQAYRYGNPSHLASIKHGLGWTRRGFIFKGWATSEANAAAGKAWKGDWGVISTGVPAGSLKDVYAVWKVDSSAYYAIKFMKNDGTSAWRTVGFKHGVSSHMPTCKNGLGWTRSGYVFKGWATSAANAAAGKVWKADYGVVASPVGKGSTLVVYAVWQKSSTTNAAAAPSVSCEAQRAASSGDGTSAEFAPLCVTGDLADGSGSYMLCLESVSADGSIAGRIVVERGDAVEVCMCDAVRFSGGFLVETADGSIAEIFADGSAAFL